MSTLVEYLQSLGIPAPATPSKGPLQIMNVDDIRVGDEIEYCEAGRKYRGVIFKRPEFDPPNWVVRVLAGGFYYDFVIASRTGRIWYSFKVFRPQ